MSNLLYKNTIDPELEKMLKSSYLGGKDLIAIIKKYKTCKNLEEKEKLREIIFNNNIRMIRKQASHFARNSPVDVEDLFGAGTVGFFDGLEKFKLSKKVMFSTYIKFWIDKEIYACLHQQNILHIPRGDFYTRKEQIKPHLNNSLLYLDAPVTSEDGQSNWNDLIEDTRSGHSDLEYFDKSKKEWAMRLVNKSLNKREKIVIRARFMHGKTRIEVGQMLGLVGQTVANIENAAIEKLQKIVKRRNTKNGIRYKKRKSGVSEEIKKHNMERLAEINRDPEMIRKRSESRRGWIMSEEQKKRLSEINRNPSLETRMKESRAQQKFPIETAHKTREMLLKGIPLTKVAPMLNVSFAWINKLMKNKLLYAKDIFSVNDLKRIKEFQFINRSNNSKERVKKARAKKIMKISDHVVEVTKNTSGGLIKKIFGFMK